MTDSPKAIKVTVSDTETIKVIVVRQAGGEVAENLEAHVTDTTNPHEVTAAQAGADPEGTASAAVGAHEAAEDPHPQYAGGGGGGGPQNPALWDSLTFLTQLFTGSAPSGQAEGRLTFVPVFLPKRTYTQMVLTITNAAVGTAHLGVYADAAGSPGIKLAEAVEIPDTNVVNMVIASFPEGVELDGWVWLCVQTSAAVSLRAGATTGQGPVVGTRFSSANSNASPVLSVGRNGTYGAALPADETGATLFVSTNVAAIIGIR